MSIHTDSYTLLKVQAGQDRTDEDLCLILRGGEAWPLEALWSRHYRAAQAWAFNKDPKFAEDVVAESFTRVFQSLLRGAGPTDSFRAYLYKAMESQFIKYWDAGRRTRQLDDLEMVSTGDTESLSDAFSQSQERSAAAAALSELPERWRDVIVAVDIEEQSVQDVAKSLDLSPNSTSALLKRARDGLRKAWMQHLHPPSAALPESCANTVKLFGIIRWGKKGTQKRTTAESHLGACNACSRRYLRFIEQATTVGLGIAGALALTRDWRDKLVPALATSAAVTLSFSVTVPVEQILREPPPPAEYSDSDSSTAQSNVGQEETYTGEDTGQTPGVDGADETDTGAETDDESLVSSDPVPTETDGETQPGADLLYFGDWSGWDEETGEFSGTK